MTQAESEGTLRKLIVGLIGAAALAAGLLLVRQRDVEVRRPTIVHAGENQPATISLDRMRERGF